MNLQKKKKKKKEKEKKMKQRLRRELCGMHDQAQNKKWESVFNSCTLNCRPFDLYFALLSCSSSTLLVANHPPAKTQNYVYINFKFLVFPKQT